MREEITLVAYEETMFDCCLLIWNTVIERDDSFLFSEAFAAGEFGEFLARQTAVYCALAGGEVAGFYILHPNQPGRGGHVANASYAVAPAFRGRGVGRALARHSLAAAKEAGFSAMQFNAVVGRNAPSHALWKSLGFAEVGRVPGAFRCHDGSFDCIVLYHKPL